MFSGGKGKFEDCLAVAGFRLFITIIPFMWIPETIMLLAMGCKVVWVPGKSGPAADGPEAQALEAQGADIRRGAKVKEVRGENKVEAVVVEAPSGVETVPVPAVFVFREIPAGPLFERAGLTLDHKQCLAVDRFQRTNLPGVFAAGDITCGGLQVVAAAGEGCVAALQPLLYLRI